MTAPTQDGRSVLLAGASGFLGQAVSAHLSRSGYSITRLVRRDVRPGAAEIAWDPARGTLDARALEGFSVVINLAGASIATRWTAKSKAAIRASRIQSTELFSRALASLRQPPRVFVSASATGYYGSCGSTELPESAAPGQGFLAEVCQAWEAACTPARVAGIRVVNPRTAVVLSAQAGALARLLPIFRLGLGGPLGDGRQYFPWITLTDFTRAIQFLIEQPQTAGPVNLCAPQAVTNLEFTRALARALRRPAWFRVPAWLLAAVIGSEAAGEMLLASQRAIPQALLNLGFDFTYPAIDQALATLLAMPSAQKRR